MSRLYDDWKKAVSHKLPKVYRRKLGKDKNNPYSAQQNSQRRVIEIPLKGGSDPVDLPDNFREVIEKEFAVRYLEQIGVEPLQKHIKKVLEEIPLEKCDIRAKWKNSGWLADVIIIDPYTKTTDSDQPVSRQLTTTFDRPQEIRELQREESKLERRHFPQLAPKSAPVLEQVEEDVPVDMELERLKGRYLYPYLGKQLKRERSKSTFQRKEDPSEIEQRMHLLRETQANEFESQLFKFPFESLKIQIQHIKELMEPISFTVDATSKCLKSAIRHFPKQQLPRKIQTKRLQNDDDIVRRNARRQVTSANNKVLIDDALQQCDTQESVRLIGLTSHFCYWTVFGQLHSIGLSDDQRQQLFITLLHLFSSHEQKCKSHKQFYLAILLLLMRVVVENIFENQYRQFFSVQHQKELAQEKIQKVISALFDPEQFYSRFSFLESGLDALEVQQKLRHKLAVKYFSTSSVVKSLFPNPQHPRTRAILAKKEAYDGKLDNLVKTGAAIAGTMPMQPGKQNYYQQSEPWKNQEYLDISSRALLYKLAMDRISSRRKRVM